MEISRQFLFNYWNFCNKISTISEDENTEDEKQRIRHEISHYQAMEPVYWFRYYFVKESNAERFYFHYISVHFLRGKHLLKKTNTSIMECYVITVYLYGSEFWKTLHRWSELRLQTCGSVKGCWGHDDPKMWATTKF